MTPTHDHDRIIPACAFRCGRPYCSIDINHKMHLFLFLNILFFSTSASADNCTATEQLVSVTFYGFPDNTPPGAGIRCNPSSRADCDVCDAGDPANATTVTAAACGPRGVTAGGTGAYDDPLTMASAARWFCRLEVVYLPYLQKYLRYEDYCAHCEADAVAKRAVHVDVWTGSTARNGGKVQIACENTLTPAGMQVIVRNPAPDLPVDGR
jgi:hypothetical protein